MRGYRTRANCFGVSRKVLRMMKEIFFVRRRGETAQIRQMLTVYSDGQKFCLHYLVLDRTKPTGDKKEAVEVAKRTEVLNSEFFLDCSAFIRVSDYPLPKLTREFIRFLRENDGTES